MTLSVLRRQIVKELIELDGEQRGGASLVL